MNFLIHDALFSLAYFSIFELHTHYKYLQTTQYFFKPCTLLEIKIILYYEFHISSSRDGGFFVW